MKHKTSNNKYQYSYINKFITKVKTLFIDIFYHPICINACLHYSWGKLVHRNWGDDINVFLIEKLFNKKVSYLYSSSISMRRNKINYIMIGSTATMLGNNHSVIWGAGIIDAAIPLTVQPLKILAVRGPLTRKYFIENGVKCPEIYGDPAMLTKLVYTPPITPIYKLGIIPHYSDFNHPYLDNFRNKPDIIIIRMENYNNWQEVVDQICCCEYIASSSLHSLIMSETYGIPNLWIELSGKLLGGHFKFHDFFLSIHADRKMPFKIKKDTLISEILATKSQYIKGHIDLEPLINSAPFKINHKYISIKHKHEYA